MIDLGDDEYTVGRPHPMIDPGLRLERLAAEAADPDCGVLLLDVVLGHGAHPDPAGELAPAIARRASPADAALAVVVSLVGTAGDPQGLAAAGRRAARRRRARSSGPTPTPPGTRSHCSLAPAVHGGR